jgi:hypothetical protein
VTTFLGVVIPIVAVLIYGWAGLTVFHRFRRRHLETCKECQQKIKQNLTDPYNRNQGYAWNRMLCDKYDIGAALLAVFWPVAWAGFLLYRVTSVDPKPSWLRLQQAEKRIAELEQEAGIR